MTIEIKQLMYNKHNTIHEALFILHEINPDIILGGSLILSELNLINRPVKDIDIIFYDNYKYNSFTANLLNDSRFIEDEETSFRNDNCNNINKISGYKYNDSVNVDIILLPKSNSIKLCEITLYNRKFLHQPVSVIIKAKQDLVNKNKHKLDLDYILSNYNPNYNAIINNPTFDDDLPF